MSDSMQMLEMHGQCVCVCVRESELMETENLVGVRDR